MEFLKDNQGISLIEYIVGGAITLILLAAAAWGIAQSTQAQGNATQTSIDNLPAMPAWN